ncbi:hypothetical protein [Streptomyces brasiliscabiei]|uniref:hypothetical protein n=1 Tax=Streptomyces brasiliscabiei TaxID=2736302 RepID=UPI0038F7132F
MSDDGEIGGGPDPVVSQPLPPEVPAPRAEPELPLVEPVSPEDGGPEPEWWRASAAPPPQMPQRPAMPPAQPANWAVEAGRGAESGDGGEAQGRESWRWDDVRDEWRDTWSTHGSEGIEAAHAIGAHIGEAVAAHLPNPHAAAERRGLDIRWMRLKYNVPAILISLLVTWRGETATGHLGESIATGGIFGLLGWVMALTIPLLLVAVLPIRTVAVTILGAVSGWVLHGLTWVFGWVWKTPGVGYLLRLVVAVAIWSTVFLILLAFGRGLIRFFTGV